MLHNNIFETIKNEIEETGDWVSLAGALGACGIHPFRATNEEITSLTREIQDDSRILKTFYRQSEDPVFENSSESFNRKVDELLKTEGTDPRMDIMVNLLLDIKE